MQVFKTYFKIIRKHAWELLMYLGIFLAITILFSSMYEGDTGVFSEQTQTSVAVINRDAASPLVDGLEKFLGKTANLVKVADEAEKIQDALYYREAEYILVIPTGFTESVKAGNPFPIETYTVPDSVYSYYVDGLTERYVRTASIYYNQESGLSESEIQESILNNLSSGSELNLKTYGEEESSPRIFFFFRYFAYVMIALCTLGVTSIMMAFNKRDVRRRNTVSPMRPHSLHLQTTLGNILFALACWMVMMVVGFLLYGQEMSTAKLLLSLGNSFIYTWVCMGIGYLIGTAIKSYEQQGAVTNILSLGTSFLCGVFVPQSLLSSSVLAVSQFLPTYWYVKAADAIQSMSETTSAALNGIYEAMIIQIGFCIALFCIALFLSKRKRVQQS